MHKLYDELIGGAIAGVGVSMLVIGCHVGYDNDALGILFLTVGVFGVVTGFRYGRR